MFLFFSKYSYLLGIYFFFTGCLIFTWDAFCYYPINFKYLIACFFFVFGSLFFAIDGHLTLFVKHLN